MTVQNQRPGVYSEYEVTSLYVAPLSEKFAAVVAKSNGGEADRLYSFATYSDACEIFSPDTDGVFMRSLIRILFDSGVSGVLAVPVASGYETAFDALETAENIGAIVCDSQDSDVLGLLKDRVQKNSAERRECLGYCGIDEPLSAISAANALNCERIVLACPRVFSQTTGARSSAIAAAAVAGKILASSDAVVNLNGETFSMLTLPDSLSEETIQSLLKAGMTVFESVKGSVEVIRVLTTKTSSNGVPDRSLTGVNSILIIDDVMASIRAAMNALLRGGRLNGSPLDSIRSQAAVVLSGKQSDGLIESFEAPRCYASPNDPSVCVVELSFTIAHIISQIHVTTHIQV